MQYLGGKSRLAPHIAQFIHANEGSFRDYIEPFVGGGSCFYNIAPYFTGKHTMSDKHEELIMMWTAAVGGWIPPTNISKDEYYEIKQGPKGPLRGFSGFACSYLGKWWGSYAFGEPINGREINFADQGSRLVRKRAGVMRKVKADILNVSFEMLDGRVTENSCVYCDPPYDMTEKYAGAMRDFNHSDFWGTMTEWAKRGARVYVSEYRAPGNWKAVWEKERPVHADKRSGSMVTVNERLFMYRGW